MKIRSVGVESFYAGGQTEMTKLIVAFRNFANASKNETRCCKQVYLFGTCKFTYMYTAACCEALEEQDLEETGIRP